MKACSHPPMQVRNITPLQVMTVRSLAGHRSINSGSQGVESEHQDSLNDGVRDMEAMMEKDLARRLDVKS